MSARSLDQICVDTLRTLSMDAVQKANSGHPGTPMGMAPTVYTLWQHHLRYDPRHPEWPNRDRFVLSAGHACAVLYSVLFLAGVQATPPHGRLPGSGAITMEDLKNFRQEGSRCSGHPELGLASGVETTTGPLGQGAANSVGMAIAGKWKGATFNRPEHRLFDYRVYALCSDGDMMEGISGEAASLAGHLRLGNLCWIYDANRISIEGSTDLAFTEDVGARFQAYGWRVADVDDANDLQRLSAVFHEFVSSEEARPLLIRVRSHIGYGAPHKQDTAQAHGAPLGEEEVRLAKAFYGCDPDAHFDVPPGVREHFASHLGGRGAQQYAAWQAQYQAWVQQYPDLAASLDHLEAGRLPPHWADDVPAFPADAKGLATRASSGVVLNALAGRIPWLLGGAADLAPSTDTLLESGQASSFQAPGQGGDYGGRNFHFGIREHAMCAIANGMALCGLRAYASSFFVFTDYCRPALRLSAIMGLPLVFVWTHDSISLGEDGPTHQPIEQLAGLRAMPGMLVIRPADANEVASAWKFAMEVPDQPVSLVLTRQAVPTLDRSHYGDAEGLRSGAYIVAGNEEDEGAPDVLLLATGSEVALCLAAHEDLRGRGIRSRVVSMPCWALFDAQPQHYRETVLPPEIRARVAVEQAAPLGWERYVGQAGAILGMRGFGISAPGSVAARHFGFTVDHVVQAAQEQVRREGARRLLL